jgi:hypothetical protein
VGVEGIALVTSGRGGVEGVGGEGELGGSVRCRLLVVGGMDVVVDDDIAGIEVLVLGEGRRYLEMGTVSVEVNVMVVSWVKTNAVVL